VRELRGGSTDDACQLTREQDLRQSPASGVTGADASEQQPQPAAPNPYEQFCATPAAPQTGPPSSRAAALADAASASPYAIFAAPASASQPPSPRPQIRRSSKPAAVAGDAASPYAVFAAGNGAAPLPWPQPQRRTDSEETAAQDPVLRKHGAAPPAGSRAGRDPKIRGPRLVDPVLAALVHEEPPNAEVRWFACVATRPQRGTVHDLGTPCFYTPA